MKPMCSCQCRFTTAHLLTKRQAEVRKAGILPWLRPDAKSQVTIQYVNNIPSRIEAVVLSTQHDTTISYNDLKEGVMEEIIKPILPAQMIDKPTPNSSSTPPDVLSLAVPLVTAVLPVEKLSSTPTVAKGPMVAVPFPAKILPRSIDPVPIMDAMWPKISLPPVSPDEMEVQVAYAIGISQPVSINVNSFGTGKISDTQIKKLITEHFDLRPKAIVQQLDLLRPIYLQDRRLWSFWPGTRQLHLGKDR